MSTDLNIRPEHWAYLPANTDVLRSGELPFCSNGFTTLRIASCRSRTKSEAADFALSFNGHLRNGRVAGEVLTGATLLR